MNFTPNANNIPKWNDPELKAGTKIRTALWLLSEVGIGNIFTKEAHRLAFPGIAQADRRLRDLRAAGWIIQTSLEDVSLKSNEQRFAAAGLPIWDPAASKAPDTVGVTAKQRRAIFSEAGYQCQVCGIAGGESYPDMPRMSATLSVTTRFLQSVENEIIHIVECKRCRAGGSHFDDIVGLISEIGNLSGADRKVFEYLSCQTPGDALLKVWAKYRLLSKPDMQTVQSHLLKK